MTAAADGLLLPSVDALNPEQLRGGACVWCALPLTPGGDVDLGCRQDPRVAYSAAWFPRACRPCAGEEVR